MRFSTAAVLAVAAVCTAACGGSGGSGTRGAAAQGTPSPASPAAASTPPSGSAASAGRDWTRFGYDAARSNDAPHGLAASAIGKLNERNVGLPGTVDSSPILLAGVQVHGGRHDLLAMTTTYGRTLGLDAISGRTLWRFTPSSYAHVAGSPQITTATPVADPGRRFLYAASPDGRIHKLRVANGHQVTSGGWPASVTRDAGHEKIAASLNVDGPWVLVTTGGYIGDAPPYQGKVVAITRSGGRLAHVLDSLCSNRRRIIAPSSCHASDSAIWGRAGAVVDPATHRIYATSSNAPFNGSTNWGDSVLELTRGVGRLRRHYTPSDQARLNSGDIDLGSTSPALLPEPGGGRRARFLLQGGKDGLLRLLSLGHSLRGVTGAAGRATGHEQQILGVVGHTDVFTAPAVRTRGGTTTAFVATGGGTAAYRLSGGRLHVLWQNGIAGTSPVLAGNVLWVYDPRGQLVAYRPGSGRLIRRFPTGQGHWNSPIVADGRVYLPTGKANAHSTSGSLSIFAP
jgi:outer membrane protein assembly factor BamB